LAGNTLSKQNYPHYQKVAYGVYMAAKKLKHYFEEHPITVVSTTPLSKIIGCKDATGRVAKWAIELAAHTIQYKPRTTIKSQIIADFFADWGEHQYLPPALDSIYWCMNFEPLERSAGCWVEELPSVLWSLRTTPNRSVGFTPFFLVYGAEAVPPTDIEFDAPRVVQYTEKQAKEAREDGINLLEEAQEQALARSAIYQQQQRRYHSRKIRPLAFRKGDLVLRLVQNSKGMHKLSSPWEGPFIGSRVLGNGAYYLIDTQEPRKNKTDNSDKEMEHPWNVSLLRPFFCLGKSLYPKKLVNE
jgi:hypothetical protein